MRDKDKVSWLDQAELLLFLRNLLKCPQLSLLLPVRLLLEGL